MLDTSRRAAATLVSMLADGAVTKVRGSPVIDVYPTASWRESCARGVR
jgi:hypothetical protein